VLLKTHVFWQDDLDNLKGYPNKMCASNQGDSYIFVHLLNTKVVEWTQVSDWLC
jgi:hypothetical protein